MKNIYAILAILTTLFINAQEQELPNKDNQKRHDFKVGIIKPGILNTIDLEYEYFFPNAFALGVNFTRTFDNNVPVTNFNYSIDYSVSPYIRFYIIKSKRKNGSGPFIQNFASYYGVKEFKKYKIRIETEANPNPSYSKYDFTKKYNAIDLGFGAGQKWVFKNRFVVQIFAAPSIVFLNDKDLRITGFFHGDVYLGYRLF